MLHCQKVTLLNSWYSDIATLFCCHIVTLLHSCVAILFHCHIIQLPHCHIAKLLRCHIVTYWHNYVATNYNITWSSCQEVLVPHCCIATKWNCLVVIFLQSNVALLHRCVASQSGFHRVAELLLLLLLPGKVVTSGWVKNFSSCVTVSWIFADVLPAAAFYQSNSWPVDVWEIVLRENICCDVLWIKIKEGGEN